VCFVVAATGAITKAPENSIGLLTDVIHLECEATDDIEWLRDNAGITDVGCSDLSPEFSTAAGSTATDCTLVVQGQYGPFSCFDKNEHAEAAVIVVGQYMYDRFSSNTHARAFNGPISGTACPGEPVPA